MPATSNRNNMLAGAFLIAALALAVVLSFVLSGVGERLIPTTPFTLRFPVSVGAAGIKAGSPVSLGGHRVGRVVGVRIERGGPAGTPVALLVQVRVRSDLTLFEDALVFLERPLLGSQSEINIADAGDGTMVESPQGGDARLGADEVVVASLAPPVFLAQAGYGPEQADQIRRAIAKSVELVDRVDRLVAAVEPEMGPLVETMKRISADAESVSSSFRQSAEGWTGRVDRILGNADDAAADLPEITDRALAGVDEARGAVARVNDAIDKNRASVDEVVENIRAASGRVSGESVDALNAALADAKEAARSIRAAADDAAGLVRQEAPNVARILANFRLAADQTKLTMIEVRRNPWRLLYQPKTKELEAELLYGAARSYAEAVSDLRAAGESLEALAASPGADHKTIADLTARLNDAFSRFDRAEQEFLSRLTDAPDPTP